MRQTPSLHDARSLSLALTREASVTGSPGEAAFPAFLRSILAQMPHFREKPEDLFLEPIRDDPRGRSNLFALVRGRGKDCIILTGHYDVVQTGMYGPLEEIAFDPEALRDRLLADLAGLSGGPNRPGPDAPLARLKADLESGDFLPGRGLLDMKSGLAAGMVVLSRFAETLGDKAKKGSMIFMAVADEEGSSLGMKAALPRLRSLLSSRGLKAAAVFNLDASVDQGSGELGRALFTGSVGKTLPFAYFLGKSAHAGAPFDGINPVLPASEFARALECAPEVFRERADVPGELPAPPTILYFRETRESYDVTMPGTVFCALNALSHGAGPESILDALSKLAAEALNKAVSTLRERASTYSRMVSGHVQPQIGQPRVLRFDEYLGLAGEGRLQSARSRAAKLHPEDRVLQTLAILEHLLPFAGLEGPAVVLGFAPPYYARAELDESRQAAFLGRLRSVLSAYAEEGNKPLRVRPFFPGISDMSLLAPADEAGERAFVRAQSPVADSSAKEGEIGSLSCPVLNLGPWGREYHQAGERVHADYAFRELPDILERLCAAALESAERGHD